MTEQEILNTIPDNWADDIDQELLQEIADGYEIPLVLAFAKQFGVKTGPSISVDKMIRNIANKQGISVSREMEALKTTCYSNAKMEIFLERYGLLFSKDSTGDYSYSIPMIRKMTGLPV